MEIKIFNSYHEADSLILKWQPPDYFFNWFVKSFSDDILKFQKLFEIVNKAEADSIIPFVLRWKAKREDIADVEPKSSFAKKVKDLALDGRVFYVGSGGVKK